MITRRASDLQGLRVEHGGNYVEVYFDCATGLVGVTSSFLSGWTRFSPGQDLPKLLATSSSGYLANRLLQVAYQYDPEATYAAIVDALPDSSWAAQAMLDWRHIADGNEADFIEWAHLGEVPDAYSLRRSCLHPEWQGLWSRLWVPHVVPRLLELSADASAGT